MDRLILVTGGRSGIGSELVQELIKNNFHVVATSRSLNSVKELNKLHNVQAHQLDLTNRNSIDSFNAWVKINHLKFYGLVNNAGISTLGSLEFIAEKEREKIIKTNLLGTIKFTLSLLPFIINNGKIINISSDEGLITLPQSAIYAISKHGLEAFSDGLRQELKYRGIRVVTINLGNVATPMLKQIKQSIEVRQFKGEPELEERFNSEKKKLLSQIVNHSTLLPSYVARKLKEILDQSDPLPYYLISTEEEREYLLTSILEKLVLLNESSPIPLSLPRLMDFLQFSYDALESLKEL